MNKTTLDVKTGSRTQFLDITGKVSKAVESSGVEEGICYLFVPHTTAGLTINENGDPNVVRDMLVGLDSIAPQEGNYLHSEGNSPAHIKSSILGQQKTVLIEGGRPVLGTWQSIYFCEFDGPRQRKLIIKVAKT